MVVCESCHGRPRCDTELFGAICTDFPNLAVSSAPFQDAVVCFLPLDTGVVMLTGVYHILKSSEALNRQLL